MDPEGALLDMAVYRCPIEQHTAEMQVAREGCWSAAWFDEHHLYPWEFNEVVGVVRLHIYCTQLRGELWWRRCKRVSPRPRRPFAWHGKLFEYHVEQESSTEIWAAIEDELRRASCKPPLKGRFLDLGCARNLAPHVNWRALVDAAVAQFYRAEEVTARRRRTRR